MLKNVTETKKEIYNSHLIWEFKKKPNLKFEEKKIEMKLKVKTALKI